MIRFENQSLQKQGLQLACLFCILALLPFSSALKHASADEPAAEAMTLQWNLPDTRALRLTCSQKDSRIAVISDGGVALLDADQGKVLETYPLKLRVEEVCFNKNETKFAAVTSSGTMFFKVSGGRTGVPLSADGFCPRFSADEKFFLCCKGQEITISDLKKHRLIGKLKHQSLLAADFLEDSQSVVSLGKNGILAWWDLETGKQTLDVQLQDVSTLSSAKIIPAEDLVVVSGYLRNRSPFGRQLAVYRLQDGSLLRETALPKGSRVGDFGADGKYAVCWDSSRPGLSLYNMQTLSQMAQVEETEKIVDAGVIKDGTSVVTITEETDRVTGKRSRSVQMWSRHPDR